VVAVSELGVQGGQMRPETAAALIGAAMLSVLLFPLLGLVLRRGGVGEPVPLSALPTAAEADGVFIEG
jgi:hypothetical protein